MVNRKQHFPRPSASRDRMTSHALSRRRRICTCGLSVDYTPLLSNPKCVRKGVSKFISVPCSTCRERTARDRFLTRPLSAVGVVGRRAFVWMSFATRQQPTSESASFKRYLSLPPLAAIKLAVLFHQASADEVVGATPAHYRYR